MVKLGDVCDILNGYAFKSEEYVSSGIRIIRIANVQKGYIEDSTPVFYPLDNRYANQYSLEDGDMLLSLTGNVGRVALLTSELLPAALNQRVACLRMKKDSPITKQFLFYFLSSDFFEKKCIGSAEGVAQKNMSTKWLRECEVPVFSTEKQQQIICVLNRLSALVSSRKQQLTKLDELVQARFVEMFERKNFPAVCIADIVDRNILSAKKKFSSSDIIEYVDISSIDNQRNVMTGFTKYIFSDAPSRAQQCIKRGDILISTVRPNLRNIAENKFNNDNLVASSGFCVLRPIACQLAYLKAVVLSNRFTDDMVKATTGANYPAIKNSDILSYKILLAPDWLQREFSDFAAQIERQKSAIWQSLDKLELLKKALMQQYFG